MSSDVDGKVPTECSLSDVATPATHGCLECRQVFAERFVAKHPKHHTVVPLESYNAKLESMCAKHWMPLEFSVQSSSAPARAGSLVCVRCALEAQSNGEKVVDLATVRQPKSIVGIRRLARWDLPLYRPLPGFPSLTHVSTPSPGV